MHQLIANSKALLRRERIRVNQGANNDANATSLWCGVGALVDDFRGQGLTTDAASSFDIDVTVFLEFLGIIDSEIGQTTSIAPRALLHPASLDAVTPIKVATHPAHRIPVPLSIPVVNTTGFNLNRRANIDQTGRPVRDGGHPITNVALVGSGARTNFRPGGKPEISRKDPTGKLK